MAISRLMNAGQAYVTLELPSGEILSGKVAVATINIGRDTPAVYSWDGNVAGRVAAPLHWSVELDGYGDMVLRQDIGVKHTGNDMDGRWQCPYCGASHPWERDKCWDGVSGCGAWRPLGLEIVR